MVIFHCYVSSPEGSKSSWWFQAWQRHSDFWGFDQALLTMACDSRGTWSSILLDFLKEGHAMGDWWLKLDVLDCDDEDFISKTPMYWLYIYMNVYNYTYIIIYIYWWYCFYTPKKVYVCPETQTISEHWMEEHMNNIAIKHGHRNSGFSH